MELRIANNHPLIEVQTNLGPKTCVVDTGSPFTFFYDDNVREYHLNGAVHTPRQAPPIASGVNDTQLIGERIDGFIGSDIMALCGDVLFDFIGREIIFGEAQRTFEHTTPMQTLFGLSMFNVSFNGRETLTAFDSGAMYSFVSIDFAQRMELSPAHGSYRDFQPGFGHFDAELHTGTITVADVALGPHNIATSSHFDKVLALLGISAFIGIDTLLPNTLLLSYRHNEVSISR